MIKDKALEVETDAVFRRRLGIKYGTNEARKDYRRWSKRVRSDFVPTDFRLSSGTNSYIDYGRSFKYKIRKD